MTPKESIAAECRRRGREAVIESCIAIVRDGEIDDDMLRVLAGPAAETVLAGGEGGPQGYWPRVWAVRGLLHEWDDNATTVIIDALGDESWRVREMAAKVVAAHQLGAALSAAATVQDDPVPRVRTAAYRAVQAVVAADT